MHSFIRRAAQQSVGARASFASISAQKPGLLSTVVLRSSQQSALYSTSGNGSGSNMDDDDILEAMMAGMDDDFSVGAPTKSAKNTETVVPRIEPVTPPEEEFIIEPLSTPPTSQAKQPTSSTPASSQKSSSTVPKSVSRPIDLEKRFKALLPEFNSYGGKRVPPPASALSDRPSSNNLTLAQLLAAGLHLGHSTSLWNVASMPFVYGIREGISIINLEHTLTHLRRACTVTKAVARQGGIILFIGTREGVDNVTIDAAQSCNAYYVAQKWCPGTITNAQEIVGPHTPRLPDAQAGDLAKPFRPDLVIVLNPLENMIAIQEATKFNIPTIAITDTDVDPRIVSYPIPANDDSVRGVQLVARVLAEAVKEGNVLAQEVSHEISRKRVESRVDRLRQSSERL